MDKQKIIHGTALEIFGYGVVLIGNSGSGKSELSLTLIDRGHKFIADDHVLIKRDENSLLWLYQSPNQFIHLGGIGFIDIMATYGSSAIAQTKTRCDLFIELEDSKLDSTSRITELSSSMNILEHNVPLTKLYIACNRPLELLVEVLVKKQQQLDNGYNANENFINNLSKFGQI